MTLTIQDLGALGRFLGSQVWPGGLARVSFRETDDQKGGAPWTNPTAAVLQRWTSLDGKRRARSRLARSFSADPCGPTRAAPISLTHS